MSLLDANSARHEVVKWDHKMWNVIKIYEAQSISDQDWESVALSLVGGDGKTIQIDRTIFEQGCNENNDIVWDDDTPYVSEVES